MSLSSWGRRPEPLRTQPSPGMAVSRGISQRGHRPREAAQVLAASVGSVGLGREGAVPGSRDGRPSPSPVSSHPELAAACGSSVKRSPDLSASRIRCSACASVFGSNIPVPRSLVLVGVPRRLHTHARPSRSQWRVKAAMVCMTATTSPATPIQKPQMVRPLSSIFTRIGSDPGAG